MSNCNEFPQRFANLTLTFAEHTTIGVYLVSSGIIAGFLNVLGITLFFVYYKTPLWTPSVIFELSLMLADLGVSGLHPFSGSSALANRWLWGPVGCQMYSFSGFFFGNFQLIIIPFIAMDRYIITCRKDLGKFRSHRIYVIMVLVSVILALVWAVAPLLNWSHYSMSPLGTYCTINWIQIDFSYISYIVANTIFCVVIPLVVTILFYQRIYSHVKTYGQTVHWASKGHEGTVMIGATLATTLAFSSGYGVTCIYAIITPNPLNMCKALHAIPPLTAKLAAPFNALFYVFMNPRHWNCAKRLFGCSYDKRILENAEDNDFDSTPISTIPAANTLAPPIDLDKTAAVV